jgi:hypothetical protein
MALSNNRPVKRPLNRILLIVLLAAGIGAVGLSVRDHFDEALGDQDATTSSSPVPTVPSAAPVPVEPPQVAQAPQTAAQGQGRTGAQRQRGDGH